MAHLLRDTWLFSRYKVRNTLRYPVFALFALFQPVLWLLLFAPCWTSCAVLGSIRPTG